jgi:hypothetical protein
MRICKWEEQSVHTEPTLPLLDDVSLVLKTTLDLSLLAHLYDQKSQRSTIAISFYLSLSNLKIKLSGDK